jgi:hypothetical protein
MKNNMGHDSKLTYDEAGEQLLVEHLADSNEPDPCAARLTELAEWCLKQVSVIDAGLLIDPNDDFWRGSKTAYQLVAIEICAMLDGES